MLRDAPLEGEIADQQAHDHRTGDVLEPRGVVEAGPKQPRAHEVDAVAERGAEAAAEKYDQETHTCSFLAPSNKKTALRRVTDGLLPHASRGRSHQPLRAVS